VNFNIFSIIFTLFYPKSGGGAVFGGGKFSVSLFKPHTGGSGKGPKRPKTGVFAVFRVRAGCEISLFDYLNPTQGGLEKGPFWRSFSGLFGPPRGSLLGPIFVIFIDFYHFLMIFIDFRNFLIFRRFSSFLTIFRGS
jgi:hypothetical protein